MADSDVLIKVGINILASKAIIKDDLKTIANQINAENPAPLQIVGNLKLADTQKKIQAQLATISKNLNVDLGINIGNIQQQVQNAVGKVNSSASSMNNIPISFDLKNMTNLKSQVEGFAKEMAKLNGFSLGKISTNLSNTDTLKTTDIQLYNEALKQTVNLKYQLSEDGRKFDLINVNTVENTRAFNEQMTKSAQNIENTKAKYERLIAEFKSSNSAILSGLSQPLADVEAKFNTLGKGTSISELVNSFEKLKTASSEVSKYLDTTNSSFNKSTNAVNNYKEMDSTLTKLTTDYDNLIVKNTELGSQISNAKTQLAELQAIEKQNGTNVEWAKKYQLVNAEIKSITTNLQLAQKSESADKNSVAQQQLKYYSKIRAEMILIQNLKNKLSSAGAEETKAIKRQITNAQKSISYAEQQIQKKNLYNETLFAETNSLKNIYAEQDKINKARQQDKANESNLKLTTDIQNATNSLATLEQKWKNQGILTGEFKEKVDQVKISLGQVTDTEGFKAYENSLKNIVNQANLLTAQLSGNNAIERQGRQMELTSIRANKLKNDIIAYMNANAKAMQSTATLNSGNTVSNELNSYVSTLQNAGNISQSELARISAGFRSVQSEVRVLGLTGNTIFGTLIEKVKKFAGWMSMTTIVAGTIRKIRGLIKEVGDLDTALIDLKKTFTGTDSELESFYYTSNTVAKQLGVTTKEIINQASAWSRLGYSSASAVEKMSKYSSMFASISPDMDVDTATNGLVSIMKAFDINEDNVLDGILSKVNIIGNTAATSNGEVVEMLTRSSSAMKEANNTLEETIALETAAVEITRDAASVGTAYKTVAMRIRGYDEETESYTNNIEELSGAIADLTKTASTPGGISLFTDSTKTEYKSTYTILKEISDIYDELTDKEQADLLEKLAGKRQGQIIAATIGNFEAAEKAINTMADSQGNALAEMEVIYESLDYRINQFKETAVGIAQDSVTRDFLKSMVDSGTEFLEVIGQASSGIKPFLDLISQIVGGVSSISSEIGLLGTTLSAIAIGKTLNGTGIFKTFMDGFKFSNVTMNAFGNEILSFKKNVESIDYKGLQKFNTQLLQGVDKGSAFNNTLMGCNSATKTVSNSLIELNVQRKAGILTEAEYTAGVKALTTATNQLTFAEKMSATASRVMGTALSMALNVGIMLVINLIITGISKLVNSQKELMESAKESAKAYKEQSETLNDLKNQYLAIIDSEKSEIEKTKELNSWKATLVDTYGFEVKALEDLNTKRERGIALIDEEIQAQNGLYLANNDNKAAYEKAKKKIVMQGSAKYAVSLSEQGQIRDSFKDLFPTFAKNMWTEDYGSEYSGVYGFDLGTDNLIEQKEIINNILSSMGSVINLTEDEQELMSYLSQRQIEINKIIGDSGEAYLSYLDALASRNVSAFIQTDGNELSKVGKDNYTEWREGLLSTANGDKELEKALSNKLLEIFPDFETPLKNQLERISFDTLKISTMSDAEKAYYYQQKQMQDVTAETTDAIEEQEKSITALKDAVDDVSNKTSLLSTIQKEMTDEGFVSSSTVAKILELAEGESDYYKCLKMVDGQLQINEDTFKEITKRKYEEEIATLKLQRAETALAEIRKGNYLAMTDEIAGIDREIAIKQGILNEFSNTTYEEKSSSSSTKSEEPPQITAFKSEYEQYQHLVNMKQMTDTEFINWLDIAYKNAYKGLEGYESDLYKYEEEVFKKRQELAKTSFDNIIEGIEKEIETLDKTTDKASIDPNIEGNIYSILDSQIALYQQAVTEIDKRIVELEKSGLTGIEDEIKELNSQRESFFDKIYDTQKEHTETGIENEIAYWNDMKEKQNEFYDKEISVLEDKKKLLEEQNEEQEKAKNLAEKQLDLQKAQIALDDARRNRSVLVYSSGGGLNYEADPNAVADAEKQVIDAQSGIEDLLKEDVTSKLDKQIEELESKKSADEEYYDKVVELLENLNGENQIQSESNTALWGEMLSTTAGQQAVKNFDPEKLQALIQSGTLIEKDGNYSLGNIKKAEDNKPTSMDKIDLFSMILKKSADDILKNEKLMSFINGGINIAGTIGNKNIYDGMNNAANSLNGMTTNYNNSKIANTYHVDKIDVGYSGDDFNGLLETVFSNFYHSLKVRGQEVVYEG